MFKRLEDAVNVSFLCFSDQHETTIPQLKTFSFDYLGLSLLTNALPCIRKNVLRTLTQNGSRSAIEKRLGEVIDLDPTSSTPSSVIPVVAPAEHSHEITCPRSTV